VFIECSVRTRMCSVSVSKKGLDSRRRRTRKRESKVTVDFLAEIWGVQSTKFWSRYPGAEFGDIRLPTEAGSL
jgi:hypothetical protein